MRTNKRAIVILVCFCLIILVVGASCVAFIQGYYVAAQMGARANDISRELIAEYKYKIYQLENGEKTYDDLKNAIFNCGDPELHYLFIQNNNGTIMASANGKIQPLKDCNEVLK